MTLEYFLKVVRARWITVCAAALIGVLVAVVLILTTKPVYQATTRLFVSTSAGMSASDLYQGNRLSQDRVMSYTELVMGRTLAQRTIDRLDLDIDAETLRKNVIAKAKSGTVLISVQVRDESPTRARDIANALSDEFVAMVSELESTTAGGPPNARVIVEQRATVPDLPIEPRKKQLLAFGLGLGVLLGVGAAVLREVLDNTVKTRDTVESSAGVGVVGSIPLDKKRRSEPAISFGADHSPIAESFRALRMNLQFLSVDDPPRVIVITSSVSGEGKSTTSINLALALAENGSRVALVDGDLRRPAIHGYLGLIGTVGFSTVLSGGASLSEALQETRFEGLSVLAAGVSPPNPSELLGSRAAKTLLDELRAEFDFVIVDSSPLLAVTDAAILSVAADGALMVVRFGSTKRDQLAHSVRSLSDVGRKPLGAVLTLVPSKRDGPYGFDYSYYGAQEAPAAQN
ncbi:polysaccharide biosynthesis tyrosine autokinase [Mycolicibacterium goodii]|uniref:non-specific protein-tyrosine kinase n=1 Tax=Mycolicibacterium goodii TaxID=134601 RepID=A0A0K0XDF0_MYCGD|nr:protein tyrosine kinase [Mycolicibacterium goodii]